MGLFSKIKPNKIRIGYGANNFNEILNNNMINYGANNLNNFEKFYGGMSNHNPLELNNVKDFYDKIATVGDISSASKLDLSNMNFNTIYKQ